MARKVKVAWHPVTHPEVRWIYSKKKRHEAPRKCFLLPEEEKFPYRNFKGDTIECVLLKAAIVRAAQHGHPKVKEKAQRLYNRYCKKKEETSMSYGFVEFAEGELKKTIKYLILPIGELYHNGLCRKIVITRELCEKLAENFKKNATRFEVPVLLEHTPTVGRVGVVTNVWVDDKGLWVELALTDEGLELVKKGKFRYMSAGFAMTFKDKKTGEELGPVLLEVSFTNMPAHPDVKPLLAELGLTFEEVIKLAEEGDLITEDVPNPADEELAAEAEASEYEVEVDEDPDLDELEAEADEALLKQAEGEAAEVAASEQPEAAESEVEKMSEEKPAAELAEKLKELESEKKELAEKLFVLEIERWAEQWVSKGVPPVVVKIAKEELLKKGSEAIKLGETVGAAGKDLRELFDKLFEALPNKVDFSQKGTSAEDDALAEERIAQRIAEFANKLG